MKIDLSYNEVARLAGACLLMMFELRDSENESKSKADKKAFREGRAVWASMLAKFHKMQNEWEEEENANKDDRRDPDGT